MFGYIIFNALPTIAVLSYTFYLTHIQFNPAKRRNILNKHQKGTWAFDTHKKIYSSQFLISWALVSLGLIVNLALNLYRSTHKLSIVVLYLALGISILFSAGALYLWSGLFRKK